MAGSRAARPIDTSTFHGRLKAARVESPYSAQELAEAMGLASAQSVYDYENPNKANSPDPTNLGVFARKTGRSLDWLVYGEAAEESAFIATMRALDGELDDRGRRAVVALAEREAEEARSRINDVGSADAMVARMTAAGFGEAEAIRAVQAITNIAPSKVPPREGGQAQPGRLKVSG